jgi:hypothetical protein
MSHCISHGAIHLQTECDCIECIMEGDAPAVPLLVQHVASMTVTSLRSSKNSNSKASGAEAIAATTQHLASTADL